ncbi:MAG: Rieske 2Fe-2S domain-containing protein [Pseudomonadota bacterium]|nr:Rieske 2Fe-2S domain-containing protein [Pseudomonadota bacterium]
MTNTYCDLAPEGRVHRRVYTDPEVFNSEMERIFNCAWVFVAHESQLTEPGQYVTAHIGERPMIVARHTDGEVYVFANRCTHRGMKLCSAQRGSKRRFVCPYHGWAFATDGSLIGIPHGKGYNGKIDPTDPALSLDRPARIENYRGFIFASKAKEGPSLTDYLGPMTRAFDNMVDRAPGGKIEAMGGGFRQRYKGNWKLHMENANDLMHASIVHASSVDAAQAVADDLEDGAEDLALQMFKGNGLPLSLMDEVKIHGFPRGHSYMGGFYKEGPITQSTNEDPVVAQYRRLMIEAYGENRALEIMGWDTFNHLIYPNLILNPKHQQMRLLQPVSVDCTIVHSTCFRLKGAPEEMYQRSVRFLSALNSPASQITTDDIAMFNNIQIALEEADTDWINLSRGLGHDRPYDNDGKIGEVGTSELPLRAQYAAWRDLMKA